MLRFRTPRTSVPVVRRINTSPFKTVQIPLSSTRPVKIRHEITHNQTRPFHFSFGRLKDEEKNEAATFTGVPEQVLTKRRAFVKGPSATAAQSGPGRNKWSLQFDHREQEIPSALMGWTGGDDPFSTLAKLWFETREAAMHHAEQNGYSVEVMENEAPPSKIVPKSYSDNFKYSPPKKIKY